LPSSRKVKQQQALIAEVPLPPLLYIILLLVKRHGVQHVHVDKSTFGQVLVMKSQTASSAILPICRLLWWLVLATCWPVQHAKTSTAVLVQAAWNDGWLQTQYTGNKHCSCTNTTVYVELAILQNTCVTSLLKHGQQCARTWPQATV
jgi:hypothetical protein